MKNTTKIISALTIALTLLMNLASCSEEMDKSNRYTFTGETIADFILNREERFSNMITILKLAEPEDVICISGSLYMIGEVRHLLGLC